MWNSNTKNDWESQQQDLRKTAITTTLPALLDSVPGGMSKGHLESAAILGWKQSKVNLRIRSANNAGS